MRAVVDNPTLALLGCSARHQRRVEADWGDQAGSQGPGSQEEVIFFATARPASAGRFRFPPGRGQPAVGKRLGRARCGPYGWVFAALCDNSPLPESSHSVARIDQTPFQIEVLNLTHDGRGVGRRENGKTVFIAGALPGEIVMAQQTGRQRSFDEAKTVQVLLILTRCLLFWAIGPSSCRARFISSAM